MNGSCIQLITVFKRVEAGSSNYLLIQLVPPTDHLIIRKEII